MLGPQEIIILLPVLYLIIRFMNRNRSQRSHFPALLLVFGLLLAVPLVLAMLFILRPSTPSVIQPTVVRQAPAAPTTVWSNLDGQPFDANVYPSESAAATPLARKIRSVLDDNQLLADQKPVSAEQPEADDQGSAQKPTSDDAVIAEAEAAPKATRLTAPAFLMLYRTAVNDTTLQRFAKQLHSDFPISEVRYAQGLVSPTELEAPVRAGGVRLVLTSSKEHLQVTENGHISEQIKGTLECRVETSHGSATVSSVFIDKPWVEDFDMYVSSRPQKHFVVGYSDELASSAQEARRRAMQDAKVKSRIAVDGVIVEVNESLVVDRFAQKLSRPYGDVWREAVLLDVSPERMQPLIAAARNTVVVVQQQRRTTAAALAILFGLTVILCLALNFLTQGYYRNRLWISAAIVVGLGLLATLV